MVVQSVALPKVSGSSRDHELGVRTAPAAVGRSFYAQALVPLIVVTQIAWVALLGYATFRFLG
ncbi:MAG TPA: hypothetical protein VLJ44_06750 [Gaiellaceae bacterium]|nr:hypothetical protein [Gaiellaceae bacterium]